MEQTQRGVLFPARLPEFHRIASPEWLAHAVRWFWIPEWDLPEGAVSRQEILPFPACNIVVEPAAVIAVGPTTRGSERVLSGSGWAVGALLRPAAARILLPDLAALRDTATPLPDGTGLHRRVADTMDEGRPRRSGGSVDPGTVSASGTRAATRAASAPGTGAVVTPAPGAIAASAPGAAPSPASQNAPPSDTPSDTPPDTASGAARRAAAVRVFCDWLRERVPQPHAGTEGDLANRLEEALADSSVVRVDQLPDRLHASTRTLQRLADRCFGLSLHVMIRRRRLQEAAERLRNEPDLRIAALASELGYSDHAHLTSDFVALLGVPPSRYREQARATA